MKFYGISIYKTGALGTLLTSTVRPFNCILFLILIFTISACSDFVEVEPPKNTLISKTVFEDQATVESALANIYFKMRDQGMVSGRSGLSSLMGIYSDELNYYLFNTGNIELYQHQVTATNTLLLGWWQQAYSLIYAANDIIKGMENATSLSVTDRSKFKGQALFVRAYMHSLLMGIYGDIPYITTTDYISNNKVSRMTMDTVYQYIIADLEQSVSLLKPSDMSQDRVIPSQAAANALLSRMYLYTKEWEMAEITADKLIGSFNLEMDITKVFLKNSKETLWQFKPNGISQKNTYEANEFTIRFIPGQAYALNQKLIDAFEPNDLRFSNWVGRFTTSNGLTTLYFAKKYKALQSETLSLEHAIVFRLSEQFLIRAESRAQSGDISGAQEDINMIRNRAGLGNTTAATKEALMDAIVQERQVELFLEHGQRWFDLKRLNLANEVLGSLKTNWKVTDVLLPIPDTELQINPMLKPQNLGY